MAFGTCFLNNEVFGPFLECLLCHRRTIRAVRSACLHFRSELGKNADGDTNPTAARRLDPGFLSDASNVSGCLVLPSRSGICMSARTRKV